MAGKVTITQKGILFFYGYNYIVKSHDSVIASDYFLQTSTLNLLIPSLFTIKMKGYTKMPWRDSKWFGCQTLFKLI